MFSLPLKAFDFSAVAQKVFDFFILLTVTKDNSWRRFVSFRAYAKSGTFLDALHNDIGIEASVFDSLSNPSNDVKVLTPRHRSVEDKMRMVRA